MYVKACHNLQFHSCNFILLLLLLQCRLVLTISANSINTKVVNSKIPLLVTIIFCTIKDIYMSALFSALQKFLFILQTLTLIRFYLISPVFKYTFVPNFATTWETGGKIFETLPREQPWVALLKYQCRDPNYFTCYPQNGWGVKEILYLMWPLAVLLLVIIIKELLSEPT